MNNRKGDTEVHSGNRRLRLLLTENEVGRIDRALFESGALNRSLLILEAVQAGIGKIGPGAVEGKRCRRIDVRIPRELKDRVKQLAVQHNLKQQSLLRHLLFQYLTLAPWEKTGSVEPEKKGNKQRRRVVHARY